MVKKKAKLNKINHGYCNSQHLSICNWIATTISFKGIPRIHHPGGGMMTALSKVYVQKKIDQFTVSDPVSNLSENVFFIYMS